MKKSRIPGAGESFDPGPGVEITCPFCGGRVRAATGNAAGGPPSAMHTVPMCSRFELLDPWAFLAEACAELERRAGKEPPR